VEMIAKPLQNVPALSTGDFALHFRQREMNDVVMMNLLAGKMIAQFQPDPVEQVDFLGRQPGGVRTQIEHLFLQ
jgi:hypothetical protein